MSPSTQTPRAFTLAGGEAAEGFTIWLAGSWGMEHRPRLVGVLAATPHVARDVRIDCRRITLIDSSTLDAMTQFADNCTYRDVACTFECDEDPVGRLITIARLDRLTVKHRPLVKRTAG